MGLLEKLNSIKNETDTLISYSNNITGKNDTTLGDAIESLGLYYNENPVEDIELNYDDDGNIVVSGTIMLDNEGNIVIGNGSTTQYELVGEASEVINVGKDTTFKNLTPTTTEQTILASHSNGKMIEFDEPIDLTEYDVFCVSRTEIKYKYTETPPTPYTYYSSNICCNRVSSYEYYSTASGDKLYYGRTFPSASTYVCYYNPTTSSDIANSTSTAYGIGLANFSMGTGYTSSNPDGSGTVAGNLSRRYLVKVGVSRGITSVRVSTSICGSDAINLMDVDNMVMTLNMYVLKVKKIKDIEGSIMKNAWLENDILKGIEVIRNV